MNKMNLLDLDNDCLNIIGNMIKKENKRTEIIEVEFNFFMNRKEPTDPDDMEEWLWSAFIDFDNDDEIKEDVNKIIQKLREAEYDLDDYDDYMDFKRVINEDYAKKKS